MSAEDRLARLERLFPRAIDLSLGRLDALLATLGRPERCLPPVIHVAGTNGKGSTCANLRAIGEAAGWRVHVYTSPHLVHVRERFRVAGRLVGEEALCDALDRVEAANDGGPITLFEALTACAFLLFAAHPAELCVLEVGLGGRFDATNLVPPPAACAIAAISLDHQDFLGDTLAAIAGEKAGIVKPGVPVAALAQPAEAERVVVAAAAAVGATLRLEGRDWRVAPRAGGLRYEDDAGGLDLPAPALLGPHQARNAGLAVAALRASGLALPDAAHGGIARTEWPGRLQRLAGPLAARLDPSAELWLDGGHNEGAGRALAAFLPDWADRPLHLVVGMRQGKDLTGFLAPLLPFAASVAAVAEPGQHLAAPVAEIVAASGGRAWPAGTLVAALDAVPPGRSRVLVCGSLYLAGVVLRDAPPR